jgi:NADPH:quinone reductase
MLMQLLRSVRRRGTVVSIGFTGGKEPAIDVFDLIVGEKRLVGYSLHHEPEDEISRALPKLNESVKDGLLRPTIDSTVDFQDFEKGYSRLGSRKAVGSITLRF